jgi:hypothetical protein
VCLRASMVSGCRLLRLPIGCIVFIAIWSQAATAADWKERLLNEAPSKWSALEQYYSKVIVSCREILETPPGGKPSPGRFQGTINRNTRKNGEMIVCVIRQVGEYPKGQRYDKTRVRGLNSRYTFKLAKSDPNADSYILVDFQPATDEDRRRARDNDMSDCDMIFTVMNCRLADIINDSLYTINAQGMRRGEKELVQMEYARQLDKLDRINGAFPVEKATIILDPELYWCVREYHVDNPNWILDGTLEYGDSIDGFPILRRSIQTEKSKTGFGDDLTTYEFDKIVHSDIPESEFTLSAFGLPEIQVPGEQKPRTLWLWLLAAAAGCLVLALLARRAARRNA